MSKKLKLHHGQIYIHQMEIHCSTPDISPKRREFIKNSLLEHGTNLIPLIASRFESYNQRTYIIECGTDWLQIADELKMEKLWAWVLDVREGDAEIAEELIEQIRQLPAYEYAVDLAEDLDLLLENFITRIESTLHIATDNIRNTQNRLDKLEKKVDQLCNQITTLTQKINNVSNCVDTSNQQTIQLDKMVQRLEDIGKKQANTSRYIADEISKCIEGTMDNIFKTQQLRQSIKKAFDQREYSLKKAVLLLPKSSRESYIVREYERFTLSKLKEIAQHKDIKLNSSMNKKYVILALARDFLSNLEMIEE